MQLGGNGLRCIVRGDAFWDPAGKAALPTGARDGNLGKDGIPGEPQARGKGWHPTPVKSPHLCQDPDCSASAVPPGGSRP